MAKETFRTWNPNTASRNRLTNINTILDKYDGMGINVTLRQLYYRLVGGGIVPNEQREYKMLGSLLSKARMAGLVDWDIIEDRVRIPRILMEFDNLAGAVQRMIRNFRLRRWNDQEEMVELWVEKDALSSVLIPITDDLHVPLMVNRGYSSTTAMKDAADRIKEYDKPTHILYLGDLDPSGEDMVRDIEERLYEFECRDFDIVKIALNPDQVKKYNLPENPVKETDSRHKVFIEKFGEHCYEVDAIPPEDLQDIVRDRIEHHMDLDAYEEIKEQEEELKNKIKKFTEDLN